MYTGFLARSAASSFPTFAAQPPVGTARFFQLRVFQCFECFDCSERFESFQCCAKFSHVLAVNPPIVNCRAYTCKSSRRPHRVKGKRFTDSNISARLYRRKKTHDFKHFRCCRQGEKLTSSKISETLSKDKESRVQRFQILYRGKKTHGFKDIRYFIEEIKTHAFQRFQILS